MFVVHIHASPFALALLMLSLGAWLGVCHWGFGYNLKDREVIRARVPTYIGTRVCVYNARRYLVDRPLPGGLFYHYHVAEHRIPGAYTLVLRLPAGDGRRLISAVSPWRLGCSPLDAATCTVSSRRRSRLVVRCRHPYRFQPKSGSGRPPLDDDTRIVSSASDRVVRIREYKCQFASEIIISRSVF